MVCPCVLPRYHRGVLFIVSLMPSKPAAPIQLHNFPLSGPGYRVKLLLSLLELPFEEHDVDLRSGQQHTPEFLAMNPHGQVPVIIDADKNVYESMAILVYLARTYADESWYPMQDTKRHVQLHQWLALSNDLLAGIYQAALIKHFKFSGDVEKSTEKGKRGLQVLDNYLGNHTWLVDEKVSIADVSCYGCVVYAPIAGIDLDPYKNVESWMRDMESLPGYIQLTS